MLDKLFGSGLRAKLLSWLFSHADERFFVRQLESILGVDIANLSRELARLAALGILTCESQGREKFYQANPRCAIFPELQGLVLKTAAVADVLKTALSPLAGRIDLAFVFGSVAGKEARADSDVDLMVVGDASFREVVSALADAQKQLAREVNPAVYDPAEFRKKAAKGHHFIRAVVDGPKLFVIGDDRELAGLVGKRLAGRP